MGAGRVHLGFGSDMVWGAGGKAANAPQWLKDAVSGVKLGNAPPVAAGNAPAADGRVTQVGDRNSQAAADAVTNAISGAIRPPGASSSSSGPSLGPSMADFDQQLYDSGLKLQNHAQQLSDTLTSDEAMNRDAAVFNTIGTRPDKNLSKAELVKKIHTEIGQADGVKDDASGLRELDITNHVNEIATKYGVSDDVAGAILKNAVVGTSWGLRWLKGPTHADMDKVDEVARKFINPDGKTEAEKLSGSIEKFAALRQRTYIAQRAQQLGSTVKSLEQEYFNALQRKRAGFSVDTDTPRLRYQAAQAQMDKELAGFDQNPMLRVNSASLTGK
jgi:hypothetical protein